MCNIPGNIALAPAGNPVVAAPAGVDIVLGCNGAVWVAPHVERPVHEFGQEVDFSHVQLPPPTPQERESTSRQAGRGACLFLSVALSA